MIDKMYWACGEVLSVGAQLAEAPNLPSPDIMKRRITTLLEDMDRRGTELGIQKRDLDDAKYAIVAFLDEQLFRARWAGRQEWMLEPLQLLFFNENTAGEGFFQRLTELENDPNRVHVLEIYYLCLALGFQGKYAVRGGEGLAALMERLVGLIARATRLGDQLSPHDVPNDTRGLRGRRELPVLVIGGVVVAVAILLAVTLKIALASSTSDATAKINSGTQQLAGAKH
jgi:type VI secretion system protein ImpK